MSLLTQAELEAVVRDEKVPTRLEIVERAFSKWLYLPDPRVVHVTLGTVAANKLDGDPVWLLLVGAPGSGKSETLQATSCVDGVHAAATLTEPALLSGSSTRDRAKDASGGLLRVIGSMGILLCKDFGSVLSMHRDARAQVLAALREIYDGEWTRHVGTDGGKTLSWSGKVGLLGGCTPTIDRHHAVMGAMGQRFVLFRMGESGNAEAQAKRALAHAGKEAEMRQEFAHAVKELFANGLGVPRDLDSGERATLIALSTLVVRARSAVERDSYTRDIELIPDAEAPTRLVVMLDRLLAGLDAIGLDRQRAWSVVTKAAVDSIPQVRRDAMWLLYHQGSLHTTAVADGLNYPTTTARRALEDLKAHKLAQRIKGGNGNKGDMYQLTDWAKERFALFVPAMSGPTAEAVPGMSDGYVSNGKGAVPEMSEDALFSLKTSNDKSGTQYGVSL